MDKSFRDEDPPFDRNINVLRASSLDCGATNISEGSGRGLETFLTLMSDIPIEHSQALAECLRSVNFPGRKVEYIIRTATDAAGSPPRVDGKRR